MTLICAAYVSTGVVLGGDSRTTWTIPAAAGSNLVTNTILSDASEKIFIVYEKYIIGTCGTAFVDNLPVAHHVAKFVATSAAPASVEDLAVRLNNFFRAFVPIPATRFIVAGYNADIPWVHTVEASLNESKRLNVDPNNAITYGIYYAGDISVANRLLSQPEFNPAFAVMSIQDAVDFTRHLIRTTINQLRFEPRFATVGGPIDTAIVTPKGAQLVQKKSLTCV
jgi:hypothetical protein